MSGLVVVWTVGVFVLVVVCSAAVLYSARTEERREFRDWATIIINFATLGVIVVTVSVAYDQWVAMRHSIDETRETTQVAIKQLQATDRPWLSAKAVLAEPLRPGSDNISLIFRVVVKNIGRSVATHVDVPVRLYPQPFTETVFAEPMRAQREVCDRARHHSDPKSRLALFPDEEVSLPMSAGLSRNDLAKGQIIPVLVGCVDYRYSTSMVHHQTRFIYELNRYRRGDQMRSLIDFTKPALPPLSELFLDKYFFGGHDAD